jgi:signal transduction histidine kinase
MSQVAPAQILVVDNNSETLAANSTALKSVGWAVWEAKTGEQALGRANEQPDLVVMDTRLPDFDGMEVARRIRATPGFDRTPIVLLSATWANDDAAGKTATSGQDAYLVQPVEPTVLVAATATLLRAREAEREVELRGAQFKREREDLAKRERAALAEAANANRLKDDFLSTLSHELRSPLNAIVGWSELLKLGSLDEDETREGIDAIERNAKLQAQLISDLLDVSRITSGKLRLAIEPVDLAKVLEEAWDSVAPAAEAKGVELLQDIDPHAGMVSGDPARLQQVAWNLMSNAVKFTAAGGRVRVGLVRVGPNVELTVADSGKGIASDLLPYIFDRFRHDDAASSRNHSGLGLGLSLSKHLVEMHGGSISVASAGEGQGATFTVQLPVMALRATREMPTGAFGKSSNGKSVSSPVRLSGVRVLLVDDDADARQLTRRVLSETGAETKEAANVPEALAAVEDFKPQVLVSDLGMPEQDGFQLIRQVRSRGLTYHELPAVALTAFARTEDRRRALLAGYQVHLAKPVDPSELTAVIATLAGRTGAEA